MRMKYYDVTLTDSKVSITIEGCQGKTRHSAIRDAFNRSGFDKKVWAVSNISLVTFKID